MYHWSPTSLSFCIIMAVVTYSTFSWTGRKSGLGVLEGWSGRAGRRRGDVRMREGQVRKGGDTQVA